MKINIKFPNYKTVMFIDLQDGDIFYETSNYYMKVGSKTKINAINLLTNFAIVYQNVEVVKCEQIEDIQIRKVVENED